MADTSQTISQFYQQAMQREFARDVCFRVIGITFGDNSSVTFDENDMVYARSGKVPGRNINNVAVNYMGLAFNVPGTVTYPGSEGYNIEFYCDEKSQLRDKLEKASRDIFDDKTSTGNYFIPKQGSVMTLAQLDKQLNVIKTYKLIGCSIRNIQEMNYQIAEGKGNVVNVSATIAYHYYEVE